jgi:hypothetical protein
MANNETELEKEDEALQNTEQIYDQLVDAADSTYKAQIDAANAFEKEQLKAMDQQTDFAIEEIRQNKAEAEKDYNREQAAAYADYKKQTDPYGVNAEHMASAGLSGSGYSESSKVAMYNAMQNRIASARDSIARVTANYNLAITEARAQNNVAKAKLAYETLVKTLELSLNGLQYKTNLTLEKQSAQEQTNYLDVLGQIQSGQINTENALASGSSGGSSSKNPVWAFIANAKNKKTSGSTSSGKATVDMQSILNLGKGPISATTLNNLVESGQVEEYEEDGKLKFRKVFKSDSIFNNPLR